MVDYENGTKANMTFLDNWINPADGIITSIYGTRVNPVTKEKEFHDGIDIALEMKTEIIAVKNGIVTDVGSTKNLGNYFKYKTEDGYTILYAHLSKSLAKKNEKIKKGQIVVLSGNTGRSTGPHLHYSVSKNDEPLDPFLFVVLPFTEDVKKQLLVFNTN